MNQSKTPTVNRNGIPQYRVRRKLTLMWVTLVALLLGSLSVSIASIKIPVKHESKRYLTGLDINTEVEKYIQAGYSDVPYTFYDTITNKREVTHNIIIAALSEGVPINVAMAVVSKESEFIPGAVNHNGGTSRDAGLFQVNEYTAREFSFATLMDMKVNCRKGCQILASNFAAKGNWVESFIAYNRGNTIDGIGTKYAAGVLSRIEKFDRMYNEQ